MCLRENNSTNPHAYPPISLAFDFDFVDDGFSKTRTPTATAASTKTTPTHDRWLNLVDFNITQAQTQGQRGRVDVTVMSFLSFGGTDGCKTALLDGSATQRGIINKARPHTTPYITGSHACYLRRLYLHTINTWFEHRHPHINPNPWSCTPSYLKPPVLKSYTSDRRSTLPMDDQREGTHTM